jgi:effector-binding domain-containing protein
MNAKVSPRIVHFEVSSYTLNEHRVAMRDLAEVTREGLLAIAAETVSRGLIVAGPPFVRYRRIDMTGTLDIETGIPVLQPDDASMEGIRLDRIPAGRYASVVHHGPYDGLLAANAALIRWGEGEGMNWDMRQTDCGQVFACRLEIFRTGPTQTADSSRWQTEIAIRLADSLVWSA